MNVEVEKLNRCVERINEFLLSRETQLEGVVSDIQEREKELTSIKKTYDELVDGISLDTQVIEIIKLLFDKSTAGGFSFLEQLATQALKTIFLDKEYEFVIKTGDRGGEKTVEFFLKDVGELIPIKETGGGVQVIISFVFRVYYIIKTKMRRLLVFDESFAMLSAQYQESLLDFMKLLVGKFGFNILWITHNLWLKSVIRPAYEVIDGKVRQLV